MNWLAPLAGIDTRKPVMSSHGRLMPDTSKRVTINGKTYRSMSEACRQLQCSYTKVYFLLGESWRFKKK